MNGLTIGSKIEFSFGDKVVKRDQIILRTRFSIVFVNIRPFRKNHLLVCPLFPHKRVSDLSADEFTDLFESVRLVTTGLKDLYHGFTVGIQDGPCAGQSVSHVHVHIVPSEGKREDVNFDIARVERTIEDMKEESSLLRDLLGSVFSELYT